MSKELDSQTEQDIQAFIYQQITDLEAFLSETSNLSVIEKNAKRTIKKLQKEEELPLDFQAEYCFLFKLQDQQEVLTAYGFSNDPFEAIIMAKTKMLNQLIVIQNQVVSNSDRINEINDVMNGNNIKH